MVSVVKSERPLRSTHLNGSSSRVILDATSRSGLRPLAKQSGDYGKRRFAQSGVFHVARSRRWDTEGGTAPWVIGVAIISINACLLGVAWYVPGSIENGVHDARRFFSSRPSTAAPGSKANHSSASDQPMISHRNGWDPSSQPSHATSPADASKPRSERGDLRCPAGLGSKAEARETSTRLYAIGQGKDKQGHGLSVVLNHCSPAKTGHSDRQRLIGYGVSGQPGHIGKGAVLNTWCRSPAHGETANSQVLSTLVVRNPYERLLSGYLGQVAKPSNQSGMAWDTAASASMELYFEPTRRLPTRFDSLCRPKRRQGQPCSRYGAWEASPAGFADFVRKLTAFNGSTNFGSAFAIDHLAPITFRPQIRPCLGSGRGLIRRYKVFKLERQAEWYPMWINESALTRFAGQPHWPGGCFWRAPNRTCEQMHEASLDPQRHWRQHHAQTPQQQLIEPERARSCNHGGPGDLIRGHNAGACTKMKAFYTPELVARVTAFFASDLRAFAYPPWRPSANQPKPPIGPRLAQPPGTGQGSCVCGMASTTFGIK